MIHSICYQSIKQINSSWTLGYQTQVNSAYKSKTSKWYGDIKFIVRGFGFTLGKKKMKSLTRSIWDIGTPCSPLESTCDRRYSSHCSTAAWSSKLKSVGKPKRAYSCYNILQSCALLFSKGQTNYTTFKKRKYVYFY